MFKWGCANAPCECRFCDSFVAYGDTITGDVETVCTVERTPTGWTWSVRFSGVGEAKNASKAKQLADRTARDLMGLWRESVGIQGVFEKK